MMVYNIAKHEEQCENIVICNIVHLFILCVINLTGQAYHCSV